MKRFKKGDIVDLKDYRGSIKDYTVVTKCENMNVMVSPFDDMVNFDYKYPIHNLILITNIFV